MSQHPTRRILVTGASGFVGAPVIRALVNAGHEVHGICRTGAADGCHVHHVDLLDASAVHDLVTEVRPAELVHLAWTTAHGRFWRDPANLDWVAATLSLLRSFHRAGGRRALLAGSCAEYDWSNPGPYSESAAGPRPETLYGASKLATGLASVAFGDETGLEVAWARLFHLYGPGEPPQRVVPQLLGAAAGGAHLELDDPGAVIDLLHVHDAAAALVAVLDSELVGPVNVATGEPVTLAAVAAAVSRLAGLDHRAPKTTGPSGRLVHADIGRLRREVPHRAPRRLDAGLRQLWDMSPAVGKEMETA